MLLIIVVMVDDNKVFSIQKLVIFGKLKFNLKIETIDHFPTKSTLR